MKSKTSSVKHKFIATSIIVLNLNHMPDRSGEVIPPEAHVVFDNPVPIFFEFDQDSSVGEAYLTRIGNRIVGDLHLYSTDSNASQALHIIKSLYPSIGAQRLQVYENITTHLEIVCLSLGRHGNQDRNIKTLGEGVRLHTRKDELH